MPTFTTRSTLRCPPADVFALVVDLSRWSLFRGAGPVPGIVRAQTEDGAPLGLGSRVRVTNTDGSVHHEVVVGFEPGRAYRVRMELTPPASRVLASIEEDLALTPTEDGGTSLVRTFVLKPTSALSSPVAWVASRFLERAVRAHDAEVARALG